MNLDSVCWIFNFSEHFQRACIIIAAGKAVKICWMWSIDFLITLSLLNNRQLLMHWSLCLGTEGKVSPSKSLNPDSDNSSCFLPYSRHIDITEWFLFRSAVICTALKKTWNGARIMWPLTHLRSQGYSCICQWLPILYFLSIQHSLTNCSWTGFVKLNVKLCLTSIMIPPSQLKVCTCGSLGQLVLGCREKNPCTNEFFSVQFRYNYSFINVIII